MVALVLNTLAQALSKATNMGSTGVAASTGAGTITIRVTQIKGHTKHLRQILQCLPRTQPDLLKHQKRPNRRRAFAYSESKMFSRAFSGSGLAEIYCYTYLRV